VPASSDAELISALEGAFATAVASGAGSQVRPYTFDEEAQTKKHQFVFFVKPEATVSPKLPDILGEVLGAFGKAGVSVGAVRILAVLYLVLIHIHTHTHTRTHIHTNTHTHTYIHTHTHTHIRTHACTHTHYAYIGTRAGYPHTHTYIHTHTHTHTHTCMHTYTLCIHRDQSWIPAGS
jgi:hypothetical protein